VKYEGKFYECLDISYDNFKYFSENQSGKCDFLNVIQGNNIAEYEFWYNRVKDFDFAGWCIGGTQKSLALLMQAIAVMLKHGEFEKARNKFIHVLGVSKISDFFVLSYFQKMINEYCGGRIQISTDSSSPGQYPVYGILLHSPQLGKLAFNMLYLPKGDDVPFRENDMIPNPYNNPVLTGMKFSDLNPYTTDVIVRLGIANLLIYNETVRQVEELVHCHDQVIEKMLPVDFYKAITSMRLMFENPDKAFEIYEKYQSFYKKYGSTPEYVDNGVINEFFK
jgi:hypothetical protein